MGSRREFLKSVAAAGALAAASRMGAMSKRAKKTGRVVVVGAGAFGGWTALYLLRAGAKVTLIDAWGPGNARASSGGETRVIRAVYGAQPIYVQMAARSLELWREHEQRWQRRLFQQTGVLWMVSGGQTYVEDSLPLLRKSRIEYEVLSLAAAKKRYPQIDLAGVQSVYLENQAGYITARLACEAVMESFVAEGGEYRQTWVQEPRLAGGELSQITLADGSHVTADRFIFACGPWLGQLFAELAPLIKPTRQEVLFFGTPRGDARFDESNLPIWIEAGKPISFYGIPGNRWRGLKVADDQRGEVIDPTTMERAVNAQKVREARDFLSKRLPAMKDAPLVEARVCQYENSPDNNFVIDRHPQAANVWIAGGGSGHGFKHGPAIGEMLSAAVMEQRALPREFALARFKS